MAQLWGEQGRRAEARDLLVPVYGWFTEGFNTADLKNAKDLLGFAPAAAAWPHYALWTVRPTSLLRHTRFAQPGEISGFPQGASLRHAPRLSNLHVGDARKKSSVQPLGFGEFSRG